MSQGKSIKLFLAVGTPSGIITAGIINRTHHVNHETDDFSERLAAWGKTGFDGAIGKG